MDNFRNLWVEKYRPTILQDLCISDETRKIIENYGADIPHLLLIGNAGVGKTTLSKIIVEDILKCDYLYINASDENGIDTIRTKVNGFINTKSFDGNIKVVILDEADALSNPAQDSLRNLMETHAKNARFILTGNFKHKIRVALQSRCQSLDIKPSLRDCINRCVFILKNENINGLTKDNLNSLIGLIKRNFPDLRKCINEMQKSCIDGNLVITSKIDNNILLDLIWNNIKSSKSLDTRKYLIENETMFNSEWDQLLKDLLNYIYKLEIEDLSKKMMIIKIAEHLDISTRVDDKEINFFACLINLELI